MNNILAEKLKELPANPGVYFHKDARGEIIYVGKAASLKNRVRQYFQKSRYRDPKTDALVAEIADVDWIVVETELDALFVEAEMVRRYMPRYNILLRDDKSSLYVRINYDDPYPAVSFTRRPLDDKAKYFGPYVNGWEIKRALKFLRRVFPYSTHTGVTPKRACLQYHLGLCPGLEENKTSLADYRANLRQLMCYLRGERYKVLEKMEHDMQRAARRKDFEAAAEMRNKLYALKALSKQVVFSDKEYLDISKDHALVELVELLGLPDFPRRIEGYDISHMQGSDVVASMVVFSNGVSDKDEYRKFKTRQNQNNDFYNMNETIKRRLSEKNRKAWGVPSLVLIDGGKGQLDAAIKARDDMGQNNIPFIGLAKREEQVVIQKQKSGVTLSTEVMHQLSGFTGESSGFILVNLPHNTNMVKLLQRIRDESHRFAVSYHSVLKSKRQTASALEDIPGIGPATRKKLIKYFGSLRAAQSAPSADVAKAIGIAKARLILASFEGQKPPLL